MLTSGWIVLRDSKNLITFDRYPKVHARVTVVFALSPFPWHPPTCRVLQLPLLEKVPWARGATFAQAWSSVRGGGRVKSVSWVSVLLMQSFGCNILFSLALRAASDSMDFLQPKCFHAGNTMKHNIVRGDICKYCSISAYPPNMLALRTWCQLLLPSVKK